MPRAKKSKSLRGAGAPTTLEDYLALPYRFEVLPDDAGSYVVNYPDLPGCFTQIERLEDAVQTARDILYGWLSVALEDDAEIPLPQQLHEYSGRILVRMPKTLHRALAETAITESVSLNSYIVSILSAGQANYGVEQRREKARSTLRVIDEGSEHGANELELVGGGVDVRR